MCMDGHSWSQAHYTVLQNSTLVTPYVDEHKNILSSIHPESVMTGLHWNSWLQKRLMCDNTISDEL